MKKENNPIIVALNFKDKHTALKTVEKLIEYTVRFKIGLPLFVKYGKDIVKDLNRLGASVFLDLKLHDIPSVVSNTIENLLDLDIEFLTVHIQGGNNMLKEAQNAAKDRIKLLGVTVLTSISPDEFQKVYRTELGQSVIKMAKNAERNGLYGVVCSGHEASLIKEATEHMVRVVPGIRLDSQIHDQQRVMPPCKAIKNGATFLVVGRDITHSKDPVRKMELYMEQLEKCM